MTSSWFFLSTTNMYVTACPYLVLYFRFGQSMPKNKLGLLVCVCVCVCMDVRPPHFQKNTGCRLRTDYLSRYSSVGVLTGGERVYFRTLYVGKLCSFGERIIIDWCRTLVEWWKQGKLKYSESNQSHCPFPYTVSTWIDLPSNLSLCGESSDVRVTKAG